MEERGNFFTRLISEIATNGKLLVGYVIQEAPGITEYPGLYDSAKDAALHTSPQTVGYFALQVFLAAAAAHRAIKIVKVAANPDGTDSDSDSQ